MWLLRVNVLFTMAAMVVVMMGVRILVVALFAVKNQKVKSE